MKPRLLIRKATKEDAAAIIQIHYDAVHTTASKDYDDSILNVWSAAVTPERIDRHVQQLEQNPDGAVVLVTETDKQVVGFGEVVPKNHELRAVYVSPKAGRKGVGSAILAELEKVAQEQNVQELWLDSSITAEPFYSTHGWTITEHSEESEIYKSDQASWHSAGNQLNQRILIKGADHNFWQGNALSGLLKHCSSWFAQFQ